MPFRDGVVLDRPVKNGCGSFVNAGMRKEVRIDKNLKPGLRVTVKMGDTSKPGAKFYSGTVVSPSSPRTEHGLYWGYSVRVAPSFGAIFTQSPYKDGYDVTIGTSERGTSVDDLELPNFRHLLVVFGGLKGLEASLESDEQLTVNEASLVFDHYVNTCPGQGSGTIRTEEAILVTMSALRPMIASATNWKPDISNSA
ncbi:putative methyltransferase C9orf114 [Montipora capricornis]|uniref:putative methyltransferase C9orf114 n=1 Tax=Montipora capricornis TaxID=246305 RepID=UPI0035F11CFA